MRYIKLVITVWIGSIALIQSGIAANDTVNHPRHAFVRIVHLSSNSPAFDFCRNGHLFAADIFYRESNRYRRVPAGQDSVFTRSFAFHECLPDLVLNTATFPGAALPRGSFVSAIALGSFFEGFPPSARIGPPALVTPDSSTLASHGMAKVRPINLARHRFSQLPSV